MSNYWPDAVEALVHRIQDNYQHVGNSAKADILETELKKMCGNESFYIMVYNDCGGYENHSFYAVVDQTIYSFRRGKCNVVIYRSLEWNRGGRDSLNQISREVESCRYGAIPRLCRYDDFPAWLMKYRIQNTCFVAMIGTWENVAIRSVNSNTEWGPGWWITATLYDQDTLRNTDTQFILIAGWK